MRSKAVLPIQKAKDMSLQKKEERTHATEDTSQAHISVGKDSAGFKSKHGKRVSVDSNGIKVTSKKLKVDVNTNKH